MRRRHLVVTLAGLLAGAGIVAGCVAGDDATTPTTEAPVDRAGCEPTSAPLERSAHAEGIDVAVEGPVEFVPGEASRGAAHHQGGSGVAEGDAHLHYCLAIANPGSDPVAVDAVQVLPLQGEEALALYEADLLTAAASSEGADPVEVRPGTRQTFELLVAADGPVDELRHRVAYTVTSSDGTHDRFEEAVARDLTGGGDGTSAAGG